MVKTLPSNAGGTGSILCWGAKILLVTKEKKSTTKKHQSIKPKYKNKNTANSSQTEFMRKCQKYAEVNEKQMGLGREGQGACMGLKHF